MLPALLIAAGLWATPSGAAAADSVPLSAAEVVERWHGRLDARRFTAQVRLRMDLGGLAEERRIVVWRDDEGTSERVMIRFEAPADLRNLALLYLEHSDRPNDYFLYQPATRRVRRVPQRVVDQDVYGIDLEFMGFGVAQSEPTRVEGMERDPVEGRAAFRVSERALRPNARFERRVTWIDAATFLPLRTEHHRDGELTLVARTTETRAVQGVPTPVRVEFERPRERRRVHLEVESVDYEGEIPEAYFSTLALIRAHVGADSPSR
jgi:hypothetical protein